MPSSIVGSWTKTILTGLLTLFMVACSNIAGGVDNPSVQQPGDSRAVSGAFVKGINFNGNAVTVEGNAWTSYASALTSGFSASAVSTFTSSLTWSPTADAATSSMLNTVIYKAGASLSLSQTLTNGNYDVYFWVTENYAANARSEDIKLEGVTVATGVGKLAKAGWAKLGPYNVTVADGSLTMDFVRVSGDPQVAGLAIFNGSGGTTPPTTTPGNLISNPDFESGNTTGWSVNGAGTLTASTAQKHSGSSSALSAGRTATWNGALQNLTSKALNGATLTASAWVRLDNAASSSVQLTLKKTDGSGTSYSNVSTKTVSNTAWTQLSGTYNIAVSGTLSELSLYVEGPAAGVNYFLDDVTVTSAGGSTNPPPPPPPTTGARPRVIHMTDLGADPDDQQTMVRTLVSANEFDIEGLIVTTSCWKTSQSSTSMLDSLLTAYGKVVSNLQVHSSGYPTQAALQSVAKLGQPGFGMAAVGSGKDTSGSDLVIAAVDKNDSRPVWVNLWGGANTLAQALWKVKNTRTPAQVDQFLSKLRVYDVLGQDDAGAWIAKTFPNLLYIRVINVYGWQPSDSWLASNVQNKGALGAAYPNRAYANEGDTPAFLYQFPNGLSNPDHPEWGGWGGRFGASKVAGVRGMTGGASYNESQYDTYWMYSDAPEGGASISRWSTAFNNDFAARMLWSVNGSYSAANHHPRAVVNTDSSKSVVSITAAAGSTVSLSAAGSTDPDGNSLSYNWSFYKEPSTYQGSVSLQNSTSSSASITVPPGTSGKVLHLVLEVRDSGTPVLSAFRRVVVTVQ